VDADRLQGQLLVAKPPLSDRNFDRTVVLMLAHDPDEGAVGVVLNRPSPMPVGERIPGWEGRSAEPALFFVGGPVGRSGIVGLARAGRPVEPSDDGWTPVLGPFGMVDLERRPDDLVPSPECVRLFSGHAGWAPGQLEREIELGGWFVVGAEPDDLFTDDPAELWSTVLLRQGAPVALYGTYPPDITAN
jgi:putative transcriptional regulator